MKLLDRTADAGLANVRVLRKALLASLTDVPLKPYMLNEMQLVYSELATNTIRHGRPAPRSIGLEVELAGLWLRLTVICDGGPFREFAERCKQVQTHDIAAHGESGLGLLLAQDIAHHLAYYPGPPNRLNIWRPVIGRRPAVLLLDADATRLARRAAALRPELRVMAATNADLATALLQQRFIDIVMCAGNPRDFGLSRNPADGPLPPMLELNDRQYGENDNGLLHLRYTARSLAAATIRKLSSAAPHPVQPNWSVETWPGYEVVLATNAPASSPPLGLTALVDGQRDGHRIVLLEDLRFGDVAQRSLALISERVRSLNRSAAGPSGLLTNLTAVLSDEVDAERHVAAVTTVDLTSTGHVVLASGTARSAALLYKEQRRTIATRGPAVGLSKSHIYEGKLIALREGEQLVLASENVHSGPPWQNVPLPDWVLEIVASAGNSPANELVRRLESELQLRLANSPRDAAVLVVRRVARPAAS